MSCAGAGAGDDSASSNGAATRPSTAAALAAKRRGEAALRNCGLGYTVVRPGPLMEEPGGYKALVFDQVGNTFCSPEVLLFYFGWASACKASGGSGCRAQCAGTRYA